MIKNNICCFSLACPVQLKIILLALLSYSGCVNALTYSYTTLDNPNSNGNLKFTDAYDINNNGQIAGWFSGIGSNTHGFTYENGSYTTLDVPGALSTYANGINDGGQITGSFLDNTGIHSYIYSGNAFTILDNPNATQDGGIFRGTNARGINNSGQVTGFFYNTSGIHSFIFDGSTYTTLDAPNATDTTWAEGINDSGQVVGYYHNDLGYHGFLFDGSTYTTIDNLNAAGGASSGTIINGINNNGQVTGYFMNQGVNSFIYDGSTYTSIEMPNSGITWARGINDNGQVVGNLNLNSGFLATPTVVPVPGAVWLFGSGLIGLIGVRTKPRKLSFVS